VTRDEEAVIKDRFRDVEDPLKFVIVTAKLLTGFDAPIEGVLYLAKPLRAHTLFQAVCRTNRRWTNPITGQEKLHGLVVDYIGMGMQLAKAVAVKPNMPERKDAGQVDVLMAELRDSIAGLLDMFESIDRAAPLFDRIHMAQEILAQGDKRAEFATEYLTAQGLFEFLWPDTKLRDIEADYKYLSQIYASIIPVNTSDMLLWHRLGAKTMALVHEHLEGVSIDGNRLENVAIDAELFESLRQLDLFPNEKAASKAPTAAEVLAKLEARIRARMDGTDPHKVWLSLAERLELLRNQKIADAQASVEFLKYLLELATDIMQAERADDDGRLDEIKVLDPRKGALTQIFEEFAPANVPAVIESVVDDVDRLVEPVRGTGWQTSQPGDRTVRRELRLLLSKYGLPPEGDLFSHAYAYIRENY
jgi:type I restriction enzyme R subunit